MKGLRLSKAVFTDKLRTQMRLTLPLLESNMRSHANTSRHALAKKSGLNDNELQYALKLACGKSPKPVYRSSVEGKMYDSAALLKSVAVWCGMWSYVVD